MDTIPADTSAHTRKVTKLVTVGAMLWLMICTVSYLWITVKTLRTAFVKITALNVAASEKALAILLIVMLAGIAVTYWRWPRSLTSYFWLLCFALFSFVLLLTTRHLHSALLLGWISGLACVSGESILRRFVKTEAHSFSGQLCISASLGFTLLAVCAQALAILHRLTSPWIWASMLLLTVLQWRSFVNNAQQLIHWLNVLRQDQRESFSFPEQGILTVVFGGMILFNFMLALLPETRFDALNYQLAVPRIYLDHGQYLHLPDFFHSYFSRLFNFIFAIALGLQGPSLAKLLVFATSLVACLGVYAISQRLLDKRAALWAALFFYTTPLISWLSVTAYIDMPLTMLLTACLLALLSWLDTRESGWLWSTGLLAGAAFGTKPTAVYGLVIIALLIMIWLVQSPKNEFVTRLKSVSLCAVFAFIVAGPVYIITYFYTGNPVFPLFNAIFKSPLWEPVNPVFNANDFGVGTTWAGWLRLPFAFVFQSQLFDEMNPAGSYGVLLFLTPLAYWLYRQNRVLVTMLTASVIVYFYCWAANFQYGRYYAPLHPLVVTLAVCGAFALPLPKIWSRARLLMLGVLLIAQGLLVPLDNGDLLFKKPFQFWLGQESAEHYLSRSLTAYAGAAYLNKHTQPGERIASAGTDALRFYVKAPLDSIIETRKLQEIIKAPDNASLASALYQQGYRYIWTNTFDPVSQLPWQKYLKKEFLEQFATLEYSRAYTQVYRLSEFPLVPSPTAEAANLLLNPGFETTASSNTLTDWASSGPISLVTPALQGNASVCLKVESNLWQEISITADTLYSLTGFIKVPTSGELARLQINWLNAQRAFIDADVLVIPAETKWKPFKLAATAPTGAVYARAYLGVYAAENACFDDLHFQPGNPALTTHD